MIHLFARTVTSEWVYYKESTIYQSTTVACFKRKITLNSILSFHTYYFLKLRCMLVYSWLRILPPHLDYCCICFATIAISSELENHGFFSLLKVLWLPSHFDGLVQVRHNSIALAMDLRLSYTNPSICSLLHFDNTMGSGHTWLFF